MYICKINNNKFNCCKYCCIIVYNVNNIYSNIQHFYFIFIPVNAIAKIEKKLFKDIFFKIHNVTQMNKTSPHTIKDQVLRIILAT